MVYPEGFMSVQASWSHGLYCKFYVSAGAREPWFILQVLCQCGRPGAMVYTASFMSVQAPWSHGLYCKFYVSAGALELWFYFVSFMSV
jgi:hypothetical protein